MNIDMKNNMPMPSLDKEWQGETERTRFNGTNWEYFKEFLNAFRHEYETCLEKGYDLIDFQEWIAIEEFLGQRIEHDTFRDLVNYFNEDDEVDGNILDLGGINPIIEAFRKGDKALWTSSDSDDNTTNAECTIIGLCTDCDLFDIGIMYSIRLADGRETQAFYDELKK